MNKPKILVEFSSIIGICSQIFTNLVLQFELFRVCGNSEPVSCGTWTFEETADVSPLFQLTQQQKPFSFIFCECQNIPECCIYFVTITALQASGVPGGLPTWEVCNTQINAYAQSSKDVTHLYNSYKTIEDKGDSLINNSVHTKPKKVILKCGNSTGSRTFNSSLEEVSFQLAQVSIDTSNLCKPVVNIEFSSTVSFKAEAGSLNTIAELQYELFRACEGGTPVSIGVWIVDRIPLLSNISTETFSFTYCDCITCTGCCEYFVTATLNRLSNDQAIGSAAITVGNGRIAVFAQEG